MPLQTMGMQQPSAPPAGFKDLSTTLRSQLSVPVQRVQQPEQAQASYSGYPVNGRPDEVDQYGHHTTLSVWSSSPAAQQAAIIRKAALAALPAQPAQAPWVAARSNSTPAMQQPPMPPLLQPPPPSARPAPTAQPPLPAGASGWRPPAPESSKPIWVPSLPSQQPTNRLHSSSTQQHSTPHDPDPPPLASSWALDAYQQRTQQPQQYAPQVILPGGITSPPPAHPLQGSNQGYTIGAVYNPVFSPGGNSSPGVSPPLLRSSANASPPLLTRSQTHAHLPAAPLGAGDVSVEVQAGGAGQAWTKGVQPGTAPQPWQHLRPIKGTLRGAYKGRASEEWLAKEVQKEVDDLAKCVDAFGIVREEKLAAARRADLQTQCEALSAERSALAERVAQLAMLLPEDDGEFRRLRGELLKLEGECDAHWVRLQVELRAKAAADDLAREMQARLAWLESQLSTFGITVVSAGPGVPPTLHQHGMPAPAATRTGSTYLTGGAKPGGGGGGYMGGDTATVSDQGLAMTMVAGGTGGGAGEEESGYIVLPPPPLVTPEAVLAAVAFLRDKGELPPSLMTGYPNRHAIALRVLLVCFVVALMTGAILLTFYMTKQYA